MTKVFIEGQLLRWNYYCDEVLAKVFSDVVDCTIVSTCAEIFDGVF